jgi:predicted metal-dependent peptidase
MSEKTKVSESARKETIYRIGQMNLDVNGKMDLAISSLLNEKAIYGYCFQRMIRQESARIDTMAVTKDEQSRIMLIYNRKFVEENEVYVLHLVLEHEAQHILRRHIDRAGSRHPKGWNIAADLSVNAELEKAYLKDVIIEGRAAKLYHPEWNENPVFAPEEYNMSADWYYEKIKEAGGENGDGEPCPDCGGTGKSDGSAGGEKSDEAGEGEEGSSGGSGEGESEEGSSGGSGEGESEEGSSGGSGGSGEGGGEGTCPTCGGSGECGGSSTLDDHSFWREIANDSIAKNNIADVAQSSIKRGLARPGGSGIGGDLLEEILKANTPKVNWKKALRWFLRKSVYKNYNFTRTRANRRLGWKNPGRKKEYATDLVLAVDTSGSVKDTELSQFVAEMDKIVGEVGNLTVIEFDGEIRKITTNVTKVGGKWAFTGRGGTNFNSVMQWLRDHKADACVMLTDLYPCDVPTNPNCQILFVGTPDSDKSFNPGFGKTIRMEGAIC